MTLLGTVAHAVMERVDLTDPEADVARRLAASPEALVLRDSEAAALAADLRVAARALADELAAGLELVGREVPFVLPLPRHEPKLFLHGRLDVLVRRAGRYVVRDFKYARPGDGAAAQYGAQLGAYRLAILAAGVESADAELIFLRGGTRRSGPACRRSTPPAEEAAARSRRARHARARARRRYATERFARKAGRRERVRGCSAVGYVRPAVWEPARHS
jgi:hypothetical protein